MPNRTNIEIDADYLAELEASLRKQLAVLRGIGRAASKIDGSFSVAGVRMAERGVKSLEAFLHNCKKELGEL